MPPTPGSDRDLICLTLSGDPDAFARLVDRYRNAAWGAAYAALGHPDDAHDVAQEALVQAYLRLGQLRDPDKFGPWLRRVVARLCAERRRRHALPTTSLDDPAAPDAPAVPGPEASLERLAVRDALARLTERQRLTLTLHYLGGYSHTEIARFLEVPLPTVRSRLRHAKRLMREELTAMASDTLRDHAPDPAFTERTVREALNRAEEEHRAHRNGDALRHTDEALAALDALEPTPEHRRLRMEALWRKGDLSMGQPGETARFYEASLALAEELGDWKDLAGRLTWAANNIKDAEKAEAYLRRALEIYEEMGDLGGQAAVHMWRGSGRVREGRISEGKECLERALPLFEATEGYDYAGVCRAMLRNIEEIGAERFPDLFGWHAWCNGLDERDGVLTFGNQPGFSNAAYGDPVPMSLHIASVFTLASPVHRKLLNASVPVDGGWSGETYSHSHAPLRGEVKLLSDTERVETPAGTFEGCLLAEITLAESGLPDDAPEHLRRLNREALCGTRRVWYAPGVGLAQVHARTEAGREATIRLQAYEVNGGMNLYLPLALGNAWSYGWAGLPEEWSAKEAYYVAYQKGERWHLEGWGYFDRRNHGTSELAVNSPSESDD